MKSVSAWCLSMDGLKSAARQADLTVETHLKGGGYAACSNCLGDARRARLERRRWDDRLLRRPASKKSSSSSRGVKARKRRTVGSFFCFLVAPQPTPVVD